MSNPRPTFQPKRPVNKWRTSSQYSQNPALQENHLEMANLLCRQWKKVEDSLGKNQVEDSSYEVYREKEPNKTLVGFQPVDLDKLWSRQPSRSVLGKRPS